MLAEDRPDGAADDDDVGTTVPGGPRERLDRMLEPEGVRHGAMLARGTKHPSLLLRSTDELELCEGPS